MMMTDTERQRAGDLESKACDLETLANCLEIRRSAADIREAWLRQWTQVLIWTTAAVALLHAGKDWAAGIVTWWAAIGLPGAVAGLCVAALGITAVLACAHVGSRAARGR